MKFLKFLIKIISPPKKSKKSRKKGRGPTYRDYGREAMSKDHDIIKEVRLSCALDEKTCLRCLELDGTKNPPKLPIHKGCRCIVIPVTKTWAELGMKRKLPKGSPFSDEALKVTSRDSIYKAYLIERAKAIEKGLKDEALAQHLKKFLPSLKKRYPKEKRAFAAIRSAVFALYPVDDIVEIEDILQNLDFDYPIAPPCELGPLFKRCAELQRFDLIDKALSKYIPGYKGSLYRIAGDSVKKVSLIKAIEYNELAAKIDKKNTAIMMELGKLYRSVKRLDKAEKMFKKVLRVNPNHKGAKSEIAKLNR